MYEGRMPNRPKKPCSYPNCPALVETGKSYCNDHDKKQRQAYDRHRGTANERGYDARWRKASREFLSRAENAICAMCGLRPATLVDHIIPHKGDMKLFWDESNWQGACKRCHDVKTDKEDGGFGNVMRRGMGV